MKRVLSVLVVTIILLALPTFSFASDYSSMTSVGDIATFGHYEQDAISENGKEPIEWIILDVQDEKALLLSRYGLDTKPYNTEYDDITWEKCTLRNWLNGEFLQTAFTVQEQAAILTTTVDNSASQGCDEWNTDGGNNTQDQVFLLSCAEANRYLEVACERENTKARVAPTAYANANHNLTDSSYKTEDGDYAGWWWLRSPGDNQICVALVDTDGELYSTTADASGGVVRPALWLNLNMISSDLKSY